MSTLAPVSAPTRSSRPAAGDHGTKGLWLLAAVAVLALAWALPVPAPLERAGNLIPLTAAGKHCLGIMAFAVILWVTETLPFAATSLLVVLLIPAFGIAEYRAVVRAGFGDPVITFFIGVLILSAAFTHSGLGTRLTYQVLLRVGTRTDRVLLGVLTVGTVISMWITDMAVAAMLLPLGVGLLRDAGLKPGESAFGRSLMIATAFGPLIGGIATPAGTAANIVALAQLKQLAGVDISFFRWMQLGTPASLLMIPFGWIILRWLFPPELEQLPITSDGIRARLQALGPLTRGESRTLVDQRQSLLYMGRYHGTQAQHTKVLYLLDQVRARDTGKTLARFVDAVSDLDTIDTYFSKYAKVSGGALAPDLRIGYGQISDSAGANTGTGRSPHDYMLVPRSTDGLRVTIKGDTSGKVLKPAKLKTGFEIQVPLFLESNTKVKVDTRDGSYLGRVND